MSDIIYTGPVRLIPNLAKTAVLSVREVARDVTSGVRPSRFRGTITNAEHPKTSIGGTFTPSPAGRYYNGQNVLLPPGWKTIRYGASTPYTLTIIAVE